MFDPNVWGWPQWTVLILMFVGLAIQTAFHGKPRTDNFNGFGAIVRFSLFMFLLIFGGFFA